MCAPARTRVRQLLSSYPNDGYSENPASSCQLDARAADRRVKGARASRTEERAYSDLCGSTTCRPLHTISWILESGRTRVRRVLSATVAPRALVVLVVARAPGVARACVQALGGVRDLASLRSGGDVCALSARLASCRHWFDGARRVGGEDRAGADAAESCLRHRGESGVAGWMVVCLCGCVRVRTSARAFARAHELTPAQSVWSSQCRRLTGSRPRWSCTCRRC